MIMWLWNLFVTDPISDWGLFSLISRVFLFSFVVFKPVYRFRLEWNNCCEALHLRFIEETFVVCKLINGHNLLGTLPCYVLSWFVWWFVGFSIISFVYLMKFHEILEITIWVRNNRLHFGDEMDLDLDLGVFSLHCCASPLLQSWRGHAPLLP